MPGGNFSEAFLNHPVELNAGNRSLRIGQRRQGMDDIAQRRRLDQQNAHSVHQRQRIGQRVASQALQRIQHWLRM